MKKAMIFIFMMGLILSLIACSNNDSNGNEEDETERAHLAFRRVLNETEDDITISNLRWICYENEWNDGETEEGCIYFFTFRLPGSNADNYGEAWSIKRSWLTDPTTHFYTYETLERLNEWYDKELLSAQEEIDKAHIIAVDVTEGTMNQAQIQAALNKAKALD